MSGSSPAAALNAYIEPLQRAVSCITQAMVSATGHRPSPLPWDLLLNRGAAVNLRGGLLRTTLHLEQRYTFAEDPAASARERWRVEIAAYRYTLSEQETKRELFAFHWHPGEEQIAMPHVHPGSRILSEQALAGRHVPTGPIAVPDLLRFLIAELGVRPERADWQRVIARIGEFYGAWQVAGTCEAS